MDKRAIVDNKVMSWGYKASRTASIIIVISIVAVIAIPLFLLFYNKLVDNPEFWAVLLSCLIAIANALLLYATLNSQKKTAENERAIHEQERFETTFFNLLEYQRKLSDELSINTLSIDNDLNVTTKEYYGRSFFSFAKREIQMISKVLESSINTKYDKDKVAGFLDAYNEKGAYSNPTDNIGEKKYNSFVREVNVEFYNLIYDIGVEDRKQYLSDKNWAYSVFYRKWYIVFEHYLRNLYNTIIFVIKNTSSRKDKEYKYISFIQSQMNRDELWLIETHAKSFPRYRSIIDNTHLTDLQI